MRTATDFERTAAGISPELFAEYGDLPQESTTERIYHSTPYPEDKMILFHNESSHLPQWPLRQFFFCVIPATDRGETPLLDCRRVYDALDPELRQEFSEKGLMYVRNFSEGIDVPWQEFFHTTDQAEVERVCSEAGMGCEWTGERRSSHQSGLTRGRCSPRTGEKSFFNQIQLHHVSCLDDETRARFGSSSPRRTCRGTSTSATAPRFRRGRRRPRRAHEELCVEPPWAAGDMIVLDNMIVAHARRPFSGERTILVAMAEMVDAKQLPSLAVSE
jgi:hypothetical protein